MSARIQPIALTDTGDNGTFDKDTIHGATITTTATLATFTLPLATGDGTWFNMHFLAASGNGMVIKTADTGDHMQGGIALATDDNSGVTMTAATAGTDDTITFNGTTTGCELGSHLTFKDIAEGIWQVSGHVGATGSEATPFSATVS